jgi:hypothetical protein
VFGQNVTEHNPAPSPSGHPLLSGSIYLYLSIYLSIYLSSDLKNDIHQIFTSLGCPFFAIVLTLLCSLEPAPFFDAAGRRLDVDQLSR